MPNRMSLGRLRSGNSVTSLRRRLGQDGRDLGRDSDKGIWNDFWGRVAPPRHPSLTGPLAGIKAQPPTAAAKSGKLR